MRSPGFCVYNETSECFLSLATRLGYDPLAFFKHWFRRSAGSLDEGYWLNPIGRKKALGLISSRDLVYLDERQKIVAVIEGLSMPSRIPRRAGARSLLVLPERTIGGSNTLVGDQLIICSPEEMETRLRRSTGCGNGHEEQKGMLSAVVSQLPSASAAPVGRNSERIGRPSLCARYRHRGAMVPNTIRDVNASGLYLVTHQRWPVGVRVTMTLQPADARTGEQIDPVRMHLKVTRWGRDGLGLEFLSPGEDAAKMECEGFLLN